MSRYLSITGRTFTLWFLSAIINSVVCAVYLSLTQSDNSFGSWLFIVLICSIFISIPGFFIFWVIMITCITYKVYGRKLFRVALRSVFFLGVLATLAFHNIYSQEGNISISLLIILSAIASVMLHFRAFKNLI